MYYKSYFPVKNLSSTNKSGEQNLGGKNNGYELGGIHKMTSHGLNNFFFSIIYEFFHTSNIFCLYCVSLR